MAHDFTSLRDPQRRGSGCRVDNSLLGNGSFVENMCLLLPLVHKHSFKNNKLLQGRVL